jgi:hypothetical protein
LEQEGEALAKWPLQQDKDGQEEKEVAAGWFGAVFTFAGAVEHHAGMQIGGQKRAPLTSEELHTISAAFPKSERRIVNVGGLKGADVLVVKGGAAAMEGVDPAALWRSVRRLGVRGVDTKALMRGRVVNKRARFNFNVMDQAQCADYAGGRGTTYSFSRFPQLQKLRARFGALLAENRIAELNAEANVYHSLNSGIGFHGDTERGIVIGVNLGKQRRIEWQKFHRSLPVGERTVLKLEHGDCYFMTGLCAGTNWKRSSIETIRHRAGYHVWLDRDERNNQKKWARMRAERQPDTPKDTSSDDSPEKPSRRE